MPFHLKFSLNPGQLYNSLTCGRNILVLVLAASSINMLSPPKHNAGFYFLAEYNARLAVP
jgi:hypothetical protein